MYYLYIKKTFLMLFSVLALFSIINFFVDPENIYPKLFSSDEPESLLVSYSNKLMQSKYGILDEEFNILNERERKKALALFSKDTDCAIIGSSRIMQISSFRDEKSLNKHCKSIINLGVPGSTLEDYFSFSNILLERKNTIRTIVFGIDHWSLKFEQDGRYPLLQSDLDKMRFRLKISKNFGASSTVSLVENFINLQYLNLSLNKIFSKNKLKEDDEEDKRDEETFNYAKNFNHNNGISGTSVTLPDGSKIYSSERIDEQKIFNNKKWDGFQNYKVREASDGGWYEERAVDDFTNLVKLLKGKFNIIFIMTPYHPKVWELDQPAIDLMISIEDKIHLIAKDLNIKVIGSYNPIKIGCSKNEMFDSMHPKAKCLKKLERKIVEN